MQINITRRNSKRDRQRSSIRAVEICRALSKSALIIPALFDEAVSCMAKALVEFPTLIHKGPFFNYVLKGVLNLILTMYLPLLVTKDKGFTTQCHTTYPPLYPHETKEWPLRLKSE